MPLNNFKRIFGRTPGAQSFAFASRAGFTLVELLVVIGIIGVLSATLIGVFGGSSDSALATKCMTNLKELATASRNYGMAEGHYPAAGTLEFMDPNSNLKKGYSYEYRKGWIFNNDSDWFTKCPSGAKRTSSRISSGLNLSTYDPTMKGQYLSTYLAITNGALWVHGGKSASSYVCPYHKKIAKTKGVTPAWSYVMSSWFGYDALGVTGGYWVGWRGFSDVDAPDRTLMFAEMQFLESAKVRTGTVTFTPSFSMSGGGCCSSVDCILQYDDSKDAKGSNAGKRASSPEHIGFNHSVGKYELQAHVAYADGHVDKLKIPRNTSRAHLIELTQWLCRGHSISYVNSDYQEVKSED